MAIRKILLPLQFAATTAVTFSAAVMVARKWRAHLAVLYTAVSEDQEIAVRDLFKRLAALGGATRHVIEHATVPLMMHR